MTATTVKQQFSISNLFNGLKASFFSRPTQLKFFYDIADDSSIANSHYTGCQEVELSQIVGSMNISRCQDFDANFKLVNAHSKTRLAGVEKAWETKSLPPISLIQLGNQYFVQDGHHRVSIANAKKQAVIKANVTIVTLAETVSTDGLTPAQV